MLVRMDTDFDGIKFNFRNIDLIVYDFDGVMTDNTVDKMFSSIICPSSS